MEAPNLAMDTPIMTTLGLFIIDENHYPESFNRKPEFNIIGGGASYAIIGGRIAAGLRLSERICGIIDQGSDFPSIVEMELETWKTGIVFRKDESRLTTRGANIYEENGIRNFVYRTPKKRVLASDILSEKLDSSLTYHMCCAIDRCGETIDTLLGQAQINRLEYTPKFIFEPFPDICTNENLEPLLEILPKVDVFSPNLDEALAFYNMADAPRTTATIAQIATLFNDRQSSSGGVVLRCGELGCYIKTKPFL